MIKGGTDDNYQKSYCLGDPDFRNRGYCVLCRQMVLLWHRNYPPDSHDCDYRLLRLCAACITRRWRGNRIALDSSHLAKMAYWRH